MPKHEQEKALLRNRIAELEARLAMHDATSHGHNGSNGSHANGRANGNGRGEHKSNGAKEKSSQMASVLQALLDHLDLVVWSVDDKGIFIFHDGKGGEPLGMPAGSLLGQNIFDLFTDTAGVREAMKGKPHHSMSYLNKMVWENWYVPVKIENEDTCHVIGLSLDVTTAHHARAELEAKVALIEKQQAVIEDLETPIIQVWDRILTLPMVGVVDSRRAARVTEDLLTEVSRTQARFAILDLTGVEVVDTATAGHLLNIISAVRLLGAEGIVSGIRPNIAQTIISLGVDLSRIRTLATLRDALAYAIRQLADNKMDAQGAVLKALQRTSA